MSILGNTTTWYETKHHKPTCHNGVALVLVVMHYGKPRTVPALYNEEDDSFDCMEEGRGLYPEFWCDLPKPPQ